MIRLPHFKYIAARTIEEAAALLAEAPAETMLLAGGTDLIPNMKRRQQVPRVVVGLRGVSELRGIGEGHALTIGAGTTLTEIVGDSRLKESCRGLWQAAAQVATPHLRNMATIGGNLCLDTRCTYYDQSEEWRRAIGYCMKKDGDTCWVATSSPKCLAVSSTDTAPMLQALGARVRLASTRGLRTIDVADFFANDGMQYLTRQPDEILTDVIVPDQRGRRSAYWKLRRRGSFDFPVASVAVAARVDDDGTVQDIRVTLGSVASRPLSVPRVAELLVGHGLTDDRIADAAEAAFPLAKPMDNTDYELVWRKRMIKPLVTYALRELRGDDVRGLRSKLARQLL
ncbi:MAG TPA: FAD binding domain-containing protein [Vicinamibacterales bacterium]|nr:FAD binding domain-containing protein [Vicinamibacterales bacterium]